MPATSWGWEISSDELRSWIIAETNEWLVINKPGCVVCHPSKHGPWSSLIGACREYTGAERLHMPFRLDRETSGVLLLVRDLATGRLLQRAVQNRKVKKSYVAILEGTLRDAVDVNEPIAQDYASAVSMKQGVSPVGSAAFTRFTPQQSNSNFTLARVEPTTGRLHQIRVHAAFIGHPVAGDKLYGPDESLFLEFIEHGFTERLKKNLPLARQALHCAEVSFEPSKEFPNGLTFSAPLSEDLASFCSLHHLTPERIK